MMEKKSREEGCMKMNQQNEEMCLCKFATFNSLENDQSIQIKYPLFENKKMK